MFRSSRSDNAGRAFHGLARATIEKADDKPGTQEHNINLLAGETKTKVERFGLYGFHSVPMPPTKDSKGVKKYAQGLVAFLGGNRSHAVVIGTQDDRYEPQGDKAWKAGETGLHDHQGQMVHVSNDGIKITGGDKKLPLTLTHGSSTVTVADGKVTIKADKIILDGMVYLGGADANKKASMEGTLDTRGDADIDKLSTKVLVK